MLQYRPTRMLIDLIIWENQNRADVDDGASRDVA